MKQLVSIAFLLALLVSGCSQEEMVKNGQASKLPKVTASFDQNESRTYIENGNLLRWNENDQISFFYQYTFNSQYQFDGETGDNAGTFSPINQMVGTGNALGGHNYAVYPYASDIKITENGVITTTLPSEQSFAENSFGLGDNTMVAVTEDKNDTFLKFQNVSGYLMLRLYGEDVTVKTITLTGNNNEKLAGKATVTSTYGGEPSVSMAAEATETITLDCGEGVELGTSAENATAFWFVVPPTTFENGFTITVEDVNGGEFTKTTSKSIEIERNAVQPMAAFEVETDRVVNVSTAGTLSTLISSTEKNQIASLKVTGYLNGTDISFLQGMSKGSGSLTYLDLSEVHIVSGGEEYDYYNTKNDSGDCYTKDNVIGKHMFRNCKFETILLPNSATFIESGVLSGCTNLTTITIPKNIQSIDFSYPEYGNPMTFQNTPLTEVIVVDGNSHLSVSDGVLFDKNKTKLIKYLFPNREEESYIIPETITTIGECAFYNCNNFTSISIPHSVTDIGEYAFAGCTYVTEITLSNKLDKIAKHSFRSCGANTNGISSLTIHEGVERICQEAFHYAVIRELHLPSTLTDIDYLAFVTDRNYSKGINAIYCAATYPPYFYDSYSEYWIGTNPSTCILYVPKGSKEDYEKSRYWPFINIVEMDF